MAYRNETQRKGRFSTSLNYDENIKPDIRRPRFRSYCKALCKQSLITGFPVIATTNGLLRKTVKVLAFILCTCGFIYQASSFLQLYRAYPTLVDIKVENPDIVPLPAVTICNKNRIRRKAYCTARPDECFWFSNYTKFCWSNPKYCISWETHEDMVIAIPMYKLVTEPSRSIEVVEKFGIRQSDLLEACEVKTEDGTSPCKNFASVIGSDEYGYPNHCVAIESLWGQPDAKEEQIEVTGQIIMALKLQPEEYIAYYDLVQAHIFMHDSHSIGNPMKEGITLEAGKSYNIFVYKRITIRLPPPYKTNCTDYFKLWRQNGGHGPLTEKACEDKCKMEKMIVGCVSPYIPFYTHDHCLNSKIQENKEIEVSYTLRTETEFNQAEKCKGDQHCMHKDMNLFFIFNRLEIEKFVHEPKYESVEMFSYIGGYMGMWLGISLISLFDFLETLICLLIYPFRSGKKSKINSIQKSIIM
ncbi:uncharacterized protein NPIL_586221 [Nephila pilipes]|uniref:Uncharacterized protein n=1 Tax=Nephila pilipes TaxID=299642 RepID=A0A8X6I5U7_NEPPI|nr:uncharacterized protein NPIL_586221 [Nephila pilipes]